MENNNNNNNEQWKVINDFPNYEVSDQGNVRNSMTRRVLKPSYCSNGYQMIDLQKDSKRHHKLVHRLVGQSFISNLDNLPCIDHIDGCKDNNCVDNLRWCSRKQNSNYNNHKPLPDELKARYREYQNRDKQKEQKKQYYQNNKEQISEQKKQYREAHKEHISERQKLYYQAHKEQISEYQKQYYQQHKSNKSNEQ